MIKRSRVAACLAALTLATAHAAELKGWTQQTDDYPVTQGMQFFARQIETRTGGRYTAKVFANGALGDQAKALQMLGSGEVDFAVVNNTPLSKAVPKMEVLSLPFLFRNPEHMLGIMDGPIGQELERDLATKGFIVLGWYDGGGRSFYTRGKPLRFATDFKDQRFRVADNKLFKDMVSALGATPVVIAYKDVNKRFESNAIDGAENNIPSYEAEQHYKYAKAFSVTHHIVLPEALVISPTLWNRLSEADKAAFREAGKASATYMREQFARRIEASRAKLEKEGVKFYTLQDAGPFISRMRPIYQPYIDNPATSNMVIRIMTTQAGKGR
ncbi:MAG: TRAP transporter substrate-binding protein [Rhodocyclaceae bacterium]